MNTIQVEIIAEGMARECNPFTTKATWNEKEGHYDYSHWDKVAESQRRVFKIVECEYLINDSSCMKKCGDCCSKIGAKFTAEIVNEGVIIK